MNENHEMFGVAVVERVTGAKPATLRKWESLGVYTCELRRSGELRERGWRAYTLSDLVRIAVLLRLIDCGLTSTRAGEIAQTFDYHLADDRKGLALERAATSHRMLACALDRHGVLLRCDNPLVTQRWDRIEQMGRSVDQMIILDVSAIGLEILARLEAMESAS